MTPAGTQTTVASGLNAPDGVAVEGAILNSLAPGGDAWANAPATVPADSGGIFIADTGDNRVVKINPDGTQTTIGTGLNAPTGVAVDSVGDVFIADSGNNRVVEVTPFGAQITVASGLNDPQGVAVQTHFRVAAHNHAVDVLCGHSFLQILENQAIDIAS